MTMISVCTTKLLNRESSSESWRILLFLTLREARVSLEYFAARALFSAAKYSKDTPF